MNALVTGGNRGISSEISRDCPVCGCTEKQSLCQIRLAPVADENLPPDFHVASCTRCGFCFDDMAACQEDFDAYYANTIKYQHPDTCGSGSLSEAECERYKRVFTPCKKYIQENFCLLDIGAGKGGLLRYIANERERERERERLYAVEPSMRLIKEQDGIQFFGAVDDLIERKIRFDFVFCTHVMEHIYDLHSFIEK